MLADLVEETANSPGTNATVQLLGPVLYESQAARRPFSVFGDGADCYYGIYSGTMWELGVGRVNIGPPGTLTRTTVLLNSSGTTARLNFQGVVRVANVLPRARQPLLDSNGRLSAANLPTEVGWRVILSQTITTPAAAMDFTLPAEYIRFRLEFSEFSPTVAANLVMVFAQGGSLLLGANDYARAIGGFSSGISYGGPDNQSGPGCLLSEITGEPVMGRIEWFNGFPSVRMQGLADTISTRQLDGARFRHASGFHVIPAANRGTLVRLAFSGASIAGGRARLLGATV